MGRLYHDYGSYDSEANATIAPYADRAYTY
jgi:hypothetical protein